MQSNMLYMIMLLLFGFELRFKKSNYFYWPCHQAIFLTKKIESDIYVAIFVLHGNSSFYNQCRSHRVYTRTKL